MINGCQRVEERRAPRYSLGLTPERTVLRSDRALERVGHDIRPAAQVRTEISSLSIPCAACARRERAGALAGGRQALSEEI